MATYDIGDFIRITATWRNDASVVVDPSSVALVIQKPDGSKLTVTYASGAVVKESTGIYHYDYMPTTWGNHTYRWEGTGNAIASGQGSFFVEDRLI